VFPFGAMTDFPLGQRTLKKGQAISLRTTSVSVMAMFQQLSGAAVANPGRAALYEGVHLVSPLATDAASLVCE
jgi:hypothetical protein